LKWPSNLILDRHFITTKLHPWFYRQRS